jgi:GNAT superfamily N-acetyltransferase
MTQAPSVSDATIRAAQQRDAAALADLSGQLGYPATTEEIEGRLATIEPLDASIVLVACDRTDRPLGWGQVELRRTLVEPLAGQVMAVVVDEGSRSARVGRLLLLAMEHWASERGCRRMIVSTRVTRERAHQFYAREGYAVTKTSYLLAKELA